jgi:hypothetical protein
VKTDLRNRLQGEHLGDCLKISINGPPVGNFPYQEAMEQFFQKPRKIKCSNLLIQYTHFIVNKMSVL